MNSSTSEINSLPSQAEVKKALTACEAFVTSLKPLKRKRSPAVIMKIQSLRGGERVVICSNREEADQLKMHMEQLYSHEKLNIASHTCPIVYTVKDDLPTPLKKQRVSADEDDKITSGPDAAHKRAHAVQCITSKKTIPKLLVSSRHDRLSSDSCMLCCAPLVVMTQTPCCHDIVCVECVEAMSTAWCTKSHRKMVLLICALCGKKTSPTLPDEFPTTDSLAARYVLTFWEIVSKCSPKVRQSSAVKIWRSLQNCDSGFENTDDESIHDNDSTTHDEEDDDNTRGRQEDAEAARHLELLIQIEQLQHQLKG